MLRDYRRGACRGADLSAIIEERHFNDAPPAPHRRCQILKHGPLTTIFLEILALPDFASPMHLPTDISRYRPHYTTSFPQNRGERRGGMRTFIPHYLMHELPAGNFQQPLAGYLHTSDGLMNYSCAAHGWHYMASMPRLFLFRRYTVILFNFRPTAYTLWVRR